MEDHNPGFVNDEMNVPEIKEKIKSYRDEIPELQDVKLSQTKQELLDAAESAVTEHYQNEQGLGGEEMTMETSAAESADEHQPEEEPAQEDPAQEEPSDEQASEEDEDGPDASAFSRRSDTIGNAGNPLTP